MSANWGVLSATVLTVPCENCRGEGGTGACRRQTLRINTREGQRGRRDEGTKTNENNVDVHTHADVVHVCVCVQ